LGRDTDPSTGELQNEPNLIEGHAGRVHRRKTADPTPITEIGRARGTTDPVFNI
jgi:hypothetical protein